jgi:hypothetical protein
MGTDGARAGGRGGGVDNTKRGEGMLPPRLASYMHCTISDGAAPLYHETPPLERRAASRVKVASRKYHPQGYYTTLRTTFNVAL